MFRPRTLLVWCLALSFSPGRPSAAAADAGSEKLVALPPVKRGQKPEQTLVFARMRTQYNLYGNPLQNSSEERWIDRPLLHDRSYFEADQSTAVFQNYRVQLGQARDYGLDGLADAYHTKQHYRRFIELISSAELCQPNNGNQVMFEAIGPMLTKGAAAAAEEFGPILARLLTSPTAARLKGKVVVSSYSVDMVSPAELDKFLKILRQKYGDFWFITSIANPAKSNWSRLRIQFDGNQGKMPEKMVEELKAHLRAYLDVSDGILMNNCNHVDTGDDYFHRVFYEEFIIRLYLSVLNEPAYRGKLLGLSAALGYVNNNVGGTQYEDGTRALRGSLEAALAADPDLILMPEWNELNENTNLEPTINRGFSTKRVVRYYMQKLKDRGRLTPLAGDDPRIPNLIVSVKAFAKLDEAAFVELLNVPDGSSAQEYRVKCRLKNERDALLKEFPEQVFKAAELQEQRYPIEPAMLAQNLTVKPELLIATAAGETLEFVQLPFTITRPTWNNNLICLKQCLRDLARPDKFDVQFTPAADRGAAEFAVDLSCPTDPIRQVDILDNDTVAYSYDRKHEYEAQAGELAVHVSYNSIFEIQPFFLRLSVENGQIRYFRNQVRDTDAREMKWTAFSDSARIDWKSNCHKRGGLLVITNKDQAVLHLQSPVFDDRVPVRDIERLGSLARAYAQTVFVYCESAQRALDLPEPVRAEQLAFRTTVTPGGQDTVYRLRLVTMSGKRCERGPFVIPAAPAGQKATLRFAAPSTGESTEIGVDRARCPELVYRFDPACGALLKTAYGSRWTATLGGGCAWGGALYTFNGNKAYPAQGSLAAPQWVVEEGVNCLKFDGQGNYLHFPTEVLPAGGNFTLEFEFKPLSGKKQCLIRSQSDYQGMLNLLYADGKLEVAFFGELVPGEPPYYKEFKFSSRGEVAPGTWAKVKLTYDRQALRLTLNDQPDAELACTRKSWWTFTPFVFGGWGADSKLYFDGLLKAIKVKHYAE